MSCWCPLSGAETMQNRHGCRHYSLLFAVATCTPYSTEHSFGVALKRISVCGEYVIRSKSPPSSHGSELCPFTIVACWTNLGKSMTGRITAWATASGSLFSLLPLSLSLFLDDCLCGQGRLQTTLLTIIGSGLEVQHPITGPLTILLR